ncbi:MAG: acyl-[acyl-carrier-protein]--UDP-N-acetylglucosamine O-acyltransferase, partial [Candidatus Wallbacteria bacterium]|nr:acyl-[acyl-carrier-protein]--UDP-N-acetylglucosamine O-acyltransferase [Candidatus Wallbacteria bacterium]
GGGMKQEARSLLKNAYKMLFRSGLNTAQALEALEREFDNNECVSYLISFIRSSSRGIIKERRTHDRNSEELF